MNDLLNGLLAPSAAVGGVVVVFANILSCNFWTNGRGNLQLQEKLTTTFLPPYFYNPSSA
jgi:hypothetical protein